MKILLYFLLFTQSLFSFSFSSELPKESKQFIDSFSCFSKDDKTIISSYLLALQFRMDHVEDRDALVKSDLDYWRLWHLVSDIGSKCALNYKFSSILEETLTLTPKKKRALKRLRRIEGSIRTDGASEISDRMRQYDEKIQKKILASPPKYKLLAKDKSSKSYDLNPIKKYKENSIPKNIYNAIKRKNLHSTKENVLLHYALLREKRLRAYDKPKERKKIEQELLYLGECKKYYDLNLSGNFLQNFRRTLADRSISDDFYLLKKEFLPQEIERYCEHNISKVNVTTFTLKKDKDTNKNKRIIEFKNSKRFIATYKGAKEIKEKMNTYLALISAQMKSGKRDLLAGLKLLRLQNCLKDSGFEKSIAKDIKKNALDEEYKSVLESQFWWMMTISMKMKQEGESEELKHFFDCNQTTTELKNIQKSTKKIEHHFDSRRLHDAITQKDNIFKYYAKIFEGKSAAGINNKKAIKSGIISKKWIDKNGDITTPLGKSIKISGMPKGGISLTYTGIPKGEPCSQFIQLNKNDFIYFNSKTYDGVDYILLNEHKIKLKHYIYKYIQRLCNQRDSNKISFVKENIVVKHKYKNNKKVDSAFEKVEKIKTITKGKHVPYGFDLAKNGNVFAVIGSKAKLYSKKTKTVIKNLPDMFENSYNIAFSQDGKYLAVGRYATDIHIWDTTQNRQFKTIKKSQQSGRVRMFLEDNKTLVLYGNKILFLDIKTEKIVAEISPHFMKSKRKYDGNNIVSLVEAPDKILYIASSKGKIEKWKIQKDNGNFKTRYIEDITGIKIARIGVLALSPKDKNILMIGGNEDIIFWNLKQKKIVSRYIADEYLDCKSILISDNNQYLLAVGHGGVYLWNLNNEEQFDIINGNTIIGALFLANSTDFITISNSVDLWKIK
jgi:WD40 repeat protein